MDGDNAQRSDAGGVSTGRNWLFDHMDGDNAQRSDAGQGPERR